MEKSRKKYKNSYLYLANLLLFIFSLFSQPCHSVNKNLYSSVNGGNEIRLVATQTVKRNNQSTLSTYGEKVKDHSFAQRREDASYGSYN